jgi:hypothetical protein
LTGSGTNVLVGSSVTIGVASGYVIPTTTEESNWNSAYAAAITNATALDTANTLVLRDTNGSTAVSLSDDNSTPRLSLNHNARQLSNTTGNVELDWEIGQTYKFDNSTNYVSVDWNNFQLWSWWKKTISAHPPAWVFLPFLSLDWKACAVYGTDGFESINWDGHSLNYYGSGNLSIDYGGGGLWDPNSYQALDWVNRWLLDAIGTQSADWSSRQLLDNGIGGTIPNRLSIDWQNRYLADTYGNAVVDWQNYVLSDQDGFQIITFGNGSFKLNDEDGNPSIDYTAKQLQNGFGAVLDWSATNTVKIDHVLLLDPTSTAPSAPSEGMMYVDSAAGNHLKIYLNSAWHTII